MSKIRQRKTNEADDGLCLVTGRFLLTNGQPFPGRLVITPRQSGYYNGVFYAASSFIIRPDSDGMIGVHLPPSSVVGDYDIASNPPSIALTFSVEPGRAALNLGDVA